MTNPIRAKLIASGVLRPSTTFKRPLIAVRKPDCKTQRDVIAEKASRALRILRAAVQA